MQVLVSEQVRQNLQGTTILVRVLDTLKGNTHITHLERKGKECLFNLKELNITQRARISIRAGQRASELTNVNLILVQHIFSIVIARAQRQTNLDCASRGKMLGHLVQLTNNNVVQSLFIKDRELLHKLHLFNTIE